MASNSNIMIFGFLEACAGSVPTTGCRPEKAAPAENPANNFKKSRLLNPDISDAYNIFRASTATKEIHDTGNKIYKNTVMLSESHCRKEAIVFTCVEREPNRTANAMEPPAQKYTSLERK